MGKKDTCPFCGEKVSVHGLIGSSRWDGSKLWLQVLDVVRYLIVWNRKLLELIAHTNRLSKRDAIAVLLVVFNVLMYFFKDWLV